MADSFRGGQGRMGACSTVFITVKGSGLRNECCGGDMRNYLIKLYIKMIFEEWRPGWWPPLGFSATAGPIKFVAPAWPWAMSAAGQRRRVPAPRSMTRSNPPITRDRGKCGGLVSRPSSQIHESLALHRRYYLLSRTPSIASKRILWRLQGSDRVHHNLQEPGIR